MIEDNTSEEHQNHPSRQRQEDKAESHILGRYPITYDVAFTAFLDTQFIVVQNQIGRLLFRLLKERPFSKAFWS